jgi:hypothetical protein
MQKFSMMLPDFLGSFSVSVPDAQGEMGMSDVPQQRLHHSSTLQASLHRKLDPRRFHWMNPTMIGLVGYVLGVNFGIPVIDLVVVVYNGAIVAKGQGSSKPHSIGKYDDLVEAWRCLLRSSGLTRLEWMTAEALFAAKIGYPFDPLN